MLFVKNMVFLDGAIATLAPDLDLFGRDRRDLDVLRPAHGERIAADLGMDRRRLPARPHRREGQLRRRRLGATTLTYRELQERREVIRDRLQKRGKPRASARPCGSSSPAARSTTTAGCPPTCPMATRLIMVKADGCVAIHADGGAYKPLNWMNAPNRLVEGDGEWTVTNPKGETLTITIDEVLSRHRPRPRRRPRPAEGRRRGPPPGAAGRRLPHARGRAAPRPPRVPHRHRPGRPALHATPRGGRWPSRSSDAARSTASSSSPATSSSSTATRCSARCAACSWPRSIKPQAKAAGRRPRHRLGRGRLRRAPGHRAQAQTSLF